MNSKLPLTIFGITYKLKCSIYERRNTMDLVFEFLAWLHNLPGVDAEMGEIFQKIADALKPNN